MKLTTRDLGVKVDEMTWRQECRLYAVDGLPGDIQARVIEEDGRYRAYLLNVNMPAGASQAQHDSMEAALGTLIAWAEVARQ